MIRTVAETGSTNADMLAAAREGAPEGDWLRAERQNAGKGRVGRAWQSLTGNLHASTIVRLRPGDPQAPGLALVAGVAIEEVATAWLARDMLRLKWPNDLMAGDAKLAGILLERVGDAVVIGIGVNLAVAPDALDRPTVSLAELSGSVPDPYAFLEDLAAALAHWLARWRGEGLVPVRKRWIERAHPIGTALAASAPTGRLEGLFDGLDADGALRLRCADGHVERINAGDILLL
jgi:BirA family biotin operon repressor/biotin-[acetyl-CoA-carboxylase] ligase